MTYLEAECERLKNHNECLKDLVRCLDQKVKITEAMLEIALRGFDLLLKEKNSDKN